MEVHKKAIPYGIRWLWASMIRMVTDVISTLWSGIHIGVLGKPHFLLSGITSFVSWLVMDDISNFRGTYGRGTSHSTSLIFISTSCLDRKVSSLQAFIPLTSTIHGILMTYLSFHCLFMIGIADPKPRNLAWVWVFCQNGRALCYTSDERLGIMLKRSIFTQIFLQSTFKKRLLYFLPWSQVHSIN